MKKQYKKGENVKLSKNFHLSEFECKCKHSDCQWTVIDTEHVKKLQRKRSKWRKPVKITSGHRCEKHNRDVGGSKNSRHVKGDATDIVVIGMTPDQVADDCENFNGLGRYNTFTHIDSRPLLEKKRKARWDFRRK